MMKRLFVLLSFLILFLSIGPAQAVNIAELEKQDAIMGWSKSWKTSGNAKWKTVGATGYDYTNHAEFIMSIQELNSNAGPASIDMRPALFLPGTYTLQNGDGWPGGRTSLTTASYSAGATTINANNLIDGGTIDKGDYFSLLGYVYRVTQTTATISGGATDITFTPGLLVDTPSGQYIFAGRLEIGISNFALLGLDPYVTTLYNSNVTSSGVGGSYPDFVLSFTNRTAGNKIIISGLRLKRAYSSVLSKTSVIYDMDRYGGISTDSDHELILDNVILDCNNNPGCYGYHAPDSQNRSQSGYLTIKDSTINSTYTAALIGNPKKYQILNNEVNQYQTSVGNENVKGINIYYRSSEMEDETDFEDIGNRIEGNAINNTCESGCDKNMIGINLENLGSFTNNAHYVSILNNIIDNDLTGYSGTAVGTGIIYGSTYNVAQGGNVAKFTGGVNNAVTSGAVNSTGILVSDIGSVTTSNFNAGFLNTGIFNTSDFTIELVSGGSRQLWLSGETITFSTLENIGDADCAAPTLSNYTPTITNGETASVTMSLDVSSNCRTSPGYVAGDTVTLRVAEQSILGETVLLYDYVFGVD